MRKATVVWTAEAALVAAMLGRMGWVDWLEASHTALRVGLVGGGVLVALAICFGLCVVPLLVLGGVGWALVRLVRRASVLGGPIFNPRDRAGGRQPRRPRIIANP